MSTAVMENPMKPQPEDFRQMFEEHYDLIYRTAYSITGRPEDAEDVVQAVFLYLLRSQRPPDLTKNPKGYLYRSDVNLSPKTVRRRERYTLMGGSERFDGSTKAADLDGNEEMDGYLWACRTRGKFGTDPDPAIHPRTKHRGDRESDRNHTKHRGREPVPIPRPPEEVHPCFSIGRRIMKHETKSAGKILDEFFGRAARPSQEQLELSR